MAGTLPGNFGLKCSLDRRKSSSQDSPRLAGTCGHRKRFIFLFLLPASFVRMDPLFFVRMKRAGG